jgi:hypothetical protein
LLTGSPDRGIEDGGCWLFAAGCIEFVKMVKAAAATPSSPSVHAMTLYGLRFERVTPVD